MVAKMELLEYGVKGSSLSLGSLFVNWGEEWR
jgi:hypothetical protein